MKVLFLNTNIGYGGASKMMTWVANQFASVGHDVTFLTYRDREVCQELSSVVRYLHVPLESNSGKRNNNLWNTVRYLHSFIKKNQFELAVGFLSPSQLRLALAVLGTNTKLLFSHRGDPYQSSTSLSSKIVNLINELAFKRADYFVFQTQNAQTYYGPKIKRKSDVIANPIVPLKRTLPRQGNVEKTIIMIARLDINQKRQDLLIEAFKKVCLLHPDYRLSLYGDGNDESILRSIAGSNDNIEFKGKTNDIVTVSQNATVSVLSSDFEGIPNSLLESMSLGIPCVATDCSPGGAAMLIRNYENGILVPRGDVKALADAIVYMIEHPLEAESMGEKAKEVNLIFSENNISRKWLEVLNRLK